MKIMIIAIYQILLNSYFYPHRNVVSYMMNLPAIRYDLKKVYFQIFEIQKIVKSRRENLGYPMFDIEYDKITGEYSIKYL